MNKESKTWRGKENNNGHKQNMKSWKLIPEVESFSVNIVLDSTNSAKNYSPVTAINY